MINVIIIEDEESALNMLSQLLTEACNEVNIQAKLRSVNESVKYFRSASLTPDIIFSDVQLSDGLSFEIFKQSDLKSPVIFTTGYDQYMMQAFENNGIDFLLKPIDKSDLRKALGKYKKLQSHFINHDHFYARLLNNFGNKPKSHLLVKKGLENILLKQDNIALFYTENRIVFVIDSFLKKYIVDKTLTELEEELDQNIFFRANRRYIINLNYVRGFKPYEKVKLLVDLSLPNKNHSVVVSQETAPAFRKWMREA